MIKFIIGLVKDILFEETMFYDCELDMWFLKENEKKENEKE